jgi:DNA-binding transcriptional LysR family regulator
MVNTAGDQLFVRTSQGMEPTPHAERIAQPVRQVLAVLRSTLNAPREFDPATAERTFTLFLTDLGDSFFLPRLLTQVRTQAPGVKLVTLPIPEHNPQAALEKFSRASHAVVLPLGTGHGIVEQTMHDLGLHNQIMLRLQNLVVLPTVVAHTDLVAIVPHSIADELSTNHPLKLMTPPISLPDFDIKQCWHKRFHSDAGNQWLHKQIAQLFMRQQAPLTGDTHEL